MLNLSGPGQTEGFDQKESSRNQRPFKADAQDVARHYPELAEDGVADHDRGGEEGILAGWL